MQPCGVQRASQRTGAHDAHCHQIKGTCIACTPTRAGQRRGCRLIRRTCSGHSGRCCAAVAAAPSSILRAHWSVEETAERGSCTAQRVGVVRFWQGSCSPQMRDPSQHKQSGEKRWGQQSTERRGGVPNTGTAASRAPNCSAISNQGIISGTQESERGHLQNAARTLQGQLQWAHGAGGTYCCKDPRALLLPLVLCCTNCWLASTVNDYKVWSLRRQWRPSKTTTAATASRHRHQTPLYGHQSSYILED